jgi:hypothetical protein
MSQLRVNTITNAGGTGSTYAPGHVVQVVSTAKTDTLALSTSTYTNLTGLTATITPSSASSRILVIFDVKGHADVSLVTNIQLRLVRGTTPIYIGDLGGSRTRATFGGLISNAAFTQEQASGVFLDSPATTSAITYAVQGRTDTAAALFINRSYGDSDADGRTRTASSITLMEIAQ